jgi:hypothetical protein
MIAPCAFNADYHASDAPFFRKSRSIIDFPHRSGHIATTEASCSVIAPQGSKLRLGYYRKASLFTRGVGFPRHPSAVVRAGMA